MSAAPEKQKPGKPHRQRKLEVLELSLFCHQLSLVLKSGIHPVEGIPLIAGEMVNPALKEALLKAGDAAVRGETLHDALNETGVFPPYLIAMVRIGETTGMMETVMENLSLFYEKEDRLAKKLRGAVAYPVLLLILMLGVIVLLIAQVLPMFAKILASLGGELPQATRFLLGIGDFFSRFGLGFLLLLLVLAAGWMFALRTESGRMRWDAMKLKLPIFGKVYTKTAAARFSNGLSIVLRSGLDLLEGLDCVMDLTENRKVRKLVRQVSDSIRNGSDLGTALAAVSLFPPLFARMMQIGQKTGELDKMMGKISSVYEGEVENSLQQMTNAIEPVLVIILSAIVGVILLAVMLPLINIMGSIG